MLGFETIAKRLFGTSNERVIKELKPIVDKINALEPELEALSDAALKARTETFRQALKDGTALDDLLVPAFASIREAAKRTLGQRHFDVQLMGGMVLHQGKISEMKTGEGKTLVSTLTVYLNALSGEGVHVVTVNDYLARRDAEWMGQIYRFMDLSVGCVVPGMNETEKKAAYACDVTYGTNNEFGFDYLRDNMKFNLESMVQRVFNFAIVDEVDSILVDEARTPLVISGPTEDNSALYTQVNEIIPKLVPEDYDKDEKDRAVTLTEAGIEHVEQLLASSNLLQGGGLYDLENVSSVHHVNQALKAHKLFSRDSDYIVKDDSVVIIDEFTGRMMEGRRFSEGLHQALEAKEKVAIQNENQTLASITFQNYFRLYPKLAGMTGTAATEAEEFMDIYGLGVVEVPTHMPVCRTDEDDEVYRTGEEKNDAILDLIEACHKRGQPVLVGTVTIEKSEHLSALLKKRKIKHHVLNARYHEQEAQIIAQAGQCGAITIATNMAGRGTDIQLGGHFDMRVAEEAADIVEESQRTEKIETIRTEITADHAKVVDAGGLYVIGTERHESRRIDNQLRGRAGRQGDPGRSKFFISLEDDLMRIFGSERMDTMLVKLGLEKGECIVHPWINKALEKAQQKVEARNFDIRKNLLKYDDVMNDQRKVIYEQRLELMKSEDVSESLRDMRHEVVENMVIHHIPAKSYIEQWDTEGLASAFYRICNIRAPIADWVAEEGISDETLVERLITASDHKIAEKAANYGPDLMRSIEKGVLLQTLDQHWKEHLQQLDHLRQIVVLRAYAQKDPLNEYKVEAFNLFEAMLDDVREEITMILAHFELQNTEAPPPLVPDEPEMQAVHLNPQTNENEMAEVRQKAMPSRSRQQTTTLDPNDSKTWGRVARNAPCPCGSGRKYKHCHGKIT